MGERSGAMNTMLRSAAVIGALGLGLAWTARAADRGAAQLATPAIPSSLALATFDAVWGQVDQSSYRVGGNGLDWDRMRVEYRPRAAAADSRDALRSVLQEMLDRIGDSHFVIIPQASLSLQDPDPAPVTASGGRTPDDPAARYRTGLQVRLVDDALLVTAVADDSPAARAGIATGWALDSVQEMAVAPALAEIQALDSEAARQRARVLMQAGLQARLDSRSGRAPLRLGLLDARGAVRQLALEAQPVIGEPMQVPMLPPLSLEVDAQAHALPGGGCVGVFRFNVWVPAVADRLEQAFTELEACQGVVLDLRGNPGGVMGVMMRVAGHFVTEPTTLGTLQTGEASLNFRALPRRVTNAGELVKPFQGPLAVVVDELSMSTSEMFASGLQAVGRARVFGTATPGMALPSRTLQLPTGDLLMYAFAQYSDPLDRQIEGEGVQPDSPAPPTRQALLAGRDLPMDQAFAWIRGLPARDVGQSTSKTNQETP